MTTDTKEAPHHQAAFINVIREEGTHKEACDYLQQTWNELCEAQAENARLRGLVTDIPVNDISECLDHLPVISGQLSDLKKGLRLWLSGVRAALQEGK